MAKVRRILVVEDDPHDAEFTLRAMKKLEGTVEAEVVPDGEQALDYLHRRGAFAERTSADPVAILLDLKMPKVSGLEVLQSIKSTPELSAIPVIVFTSSRDPKDLKASYQLGSNAYVVKSLDFREFTDAVRQVGSFWGCINEPPPGA